MTTNVVVAVYDQPESGLPYLAVALVPDEIMGTITAETQRLMRFGSVSLRRA